jgi:CheY-like chemotaxis protein
MTNANVLLVFVVDDEPIIASTIKCILERSGFATVSFTDPLEVLGALETMKPDLLLCDVVMPHLSGVDLAIRVKEICPDCAVLLFSGQSETSDLLLTAQERGFDFPVLAKPIAPAALVEEIRRHARKLPACA